MNKNKRLIIVLIILSVVLAIIGATFSWAIWQTGNSENTSVTFNVTNDFSCSADGGGDITSGSVKLAPASCTDSNYVLKRTITVNATTTRTISLDLWLNNISTDSALLNSNNFKYTIVPEGSSCTSGTAKVIKNNMTNNKISLESSIFQTTGTNTYDLYIWLDEAETDINTANKNFHFTLGGNCTDDLSNIDTSGANAPELTSGMVPVKLNENGTVVTTVNPISSNDWYNYSQQKWANAVLVDSSVRSNYIDSTTGDIIPNVNVDTEKILAYYVWIPRYKYTFADNSTQNPYPVQSIDIVFEEKNAPRATGGANGPNDYYTHPAFTWNFTGDTLDETKPNLGGIWVGKFEMNYNSSGTSYSSTSIGCTDTTCANANKLRILPNKTLLRSNTVASFFYGIRSMQQSGNSFGLPTDTATADSHMMKNREWGAVAYLAHSAYGLGNQEVRKNSYSSYMTGCGASAANKTSESKCYDPYGKTTTTSPSTTGDISTYPQSTTGNITGVFDISGGVYKYVMGNYNGTNGYAGFSSLPVLKYYDKYTVTSNSSCTFAECGGHALKETANWHSDYANFVDSSNPWFLRGGLSSNSDAGAFRLGNSNGASNGYNGVRSVVVVS